MGISQTLDIVKATVLSSDSVLYTSKTAL